MSLLCKMVIGKYTPFACFAFDQGCPDGIRQLTGFF